VKTEGGKMKGISRIDSDRAQGWFVRIYYGGGQEHRKFFSDGKYGGKQQALELAVAYRDQYIEKHPPPQKLPFQSEPIASNTTGVNGVSETYQRSRSGAKIPCFSVFWAPRKNEPKTKKFYHHHYGSREEALKEAAAFRKEKEAEILRRAEKGQR
jgi:hypothetical protein